MPTSPLERGRTTRIDRKVDTAIQGIAEGHIAAAVDLKRRDDAEIDDRGGDGTTCSIPKDQLIGAHLAQQIVGHIQGAGHCGANADLAIGGGTLYGNNTRASIN